MRDRAWRRFQDERVVRNRSKFVRVVFSGWHGHKTEEWIEQTKGRWRNHHPFDCGRPRCYCCHHEKYYRVRLSHSDQRALEHAKDEENEIHRSVDQQSNQASKT